MDPQGSCQNRGNSTIVESWYDYPIIKFSEIPIVETILIERPLEKPLGAAEISQGPLVQQLLTL